MMALINCVQQQVPNVYACDYMTKCFGRHECPPTNGNVGSLRITIQKLFETTA